MIEMFNPDTPLEVALLAFLGGCSLLAAAAPAWVAYAKHGKALGDIKDQVQNDHSTNLRDDIDMLAGLIRGVAKDISVVREELLTERQERIAGDKRKRCLADDCA